MQRDACQAANPVEKALFIIGPGDLESVSQAAKRVPVNRSYLYRLIQTGKLDSYSVGGKLMLLKEDTDRFIQQRKAS
jgi:excisionase family DNA binding protein